MAHNPDGLFSRSEHELWSRANEIFQNALDLASSERTSFARRTCAEEPRLMDEVLALLAAHGASGFLSVPIPNLASQVLGRDYPQGLVGQRVGSFHIERWIASGGMGDVYVARRVHEGFEQRVALKILKRGLDTNELVERFRRERSTLALLEHPNIARLIDGGVTPDGRPFLAMEFVEGRRIDEYCDERRLTTVERLRLFVAVCRAVHYAHANLVLHRDLKPSNILVTDDGIPKLLDFGIAKVIDSNPDDESTRTSPTEHQLLTPRFASPEQLRGERVTITSDVYSLGLVLFKLLTGQLPPDRANSNAPGAQAAQLTAPIEPVSRSILRMADRDQPTDTGDPSESRKSSGGTRAPLKRERRRQMRGDIEKMVGMALRQDPTLRYESVEQFASDILRHLDGLPVIACGDTIRYRASKFIRRNKASVVSAILFVLALTAGIVATSWQARLARVERDHAVAERNHAENITSFLQETLLSASPYRGGADTNLYELLQDAERRIKPELSGDREARAKVQHAIGKAYAAMEIPHLAEKHLRDAITAYRSLYGDQHSGLAECLAVLGSLLAARADTESVSLLTESLDIRRKMFGDRHVLVADTLCLLAAAYYRASRPAQFDRAENSLNDAHMIYSEHHVPGDLHLADWADNLARLRTWQDRPEEGIVLFHEALAKYRDAGKESHPRVALILRDLGWAYANSGQRTTARDVFDQYGVQMRSVYGAELEIEGAWAHAHLDFLMGNPADALRRYHTWLVERCRNIQSHFELESGERLILQELSEIDDPTVHPGLASKYRTLLTRLGEQQLLPGIRAPETMLLIGRAYHHLGNYSEAAILLRGCIALRKTFLPNAPCKVAENMLSATLTALTKADGAE